MNSDYLMKHISYDIHTFVYKYSNSGDFIKGFCARENFNDPFISNKDILDFLLFDFIHVDVQISSIHNKIFYARIKTDDFWYLIGPIRIFEAYYFSHNLDSVTLKEYHFRDIYKCEMDVFIRDILLLYNSCHENELNKEHILSMNSSNKALKNTISKNFTELLFQNQESGIAHNPYDQEIREFLSIEQGDVEQLEKSWAEDYTGKIGTLSKDSLRNFKNICIVIITLASRAAMRGGVNPEIAYSLSDIFIMKVEELSDMAALFQLSRDAEYKYALLVSELKNSQKSHLKKESNVHISRCKEYIFKHLHEKISLQEIARTLAIHPTYLSELFIKCEGITLTNFIKSEKITLAKNLLIYSQYSYIEIATYLGYASQSHLGTHFKQLTGYTLKHYRDRYGVKEFLSSQ